MIETYYTLDLPGIQAPQPVTVHTDLKDARQLQIGRGILESNMHPKVMPGRNSWDLAIQTLARGSTWEQETTVATIERHVCTKIAGEGEPVSVWIRTK